MPGLALTTPSIPTRPLQTLVPPVREWQVGNKKVALNFSSQGGITATVFSKGRAIQVPYYEILGLPRDLSRAKEVIFAYTQDTWIDLNQCSDGSYRIHVHPRMRGGGWPGIALGVGVALTGVGALAYGTGALFSIAGGVLIGGGAQATSHAVKHEKDFTPEYFASMKEGALKGGVAATISVGAGAIGGKLATSVGKFAVKASGSLGKTISLAAQTTIETGVKTLVSAAGGATSSVLNAVIDGKEVTRDDVIIDTLIGGAGGYIGAAKRAKLAGRAFEFRTRAPKNLMSEVGKLMKNESLRTSATAAVVGGTIKVAHRTSKNIKNKKAWHDGTISAFAEGGVLAGSMANIMSALPTAFEGVTKIDSSLEAIGKIETVYVEGAHQLPANSLEIPALDEQFHNMMATLFHHGDPSQKRAIADSCKNSLQEFTSAHCDKLKILEAGGELNISKEMGLILSGLLAGLGVSWSRNEKGNGKNSGSIATRDRATISYSSPLASSGDNPSVSESDMSSSTEDSIGSIKVALPEGLLSGSSKEIAKFVGEHSSKRVAAIIGRVLKTLFGDELRRGELLKLFSDSAEGGTFTDITAARILYHVAALKNLTDPIERSQLTKLLQDEIQMYDIFDRTLNTYNGAHYMDVVNYAQEKIIALKSGESMTLFAGINGVSTGQDHAMFVTYRKLDDGDVVIRIHNTGGYSTGVTWSHVMDTSKTEEAYYPFRFKPVSPKGKAFRKNHLKPVFNALRPGPTIVGNIAIDMHLSKDRRSYSFAAAEKIYTGLEREEESLHREGYESVEKQTRFNCTLKSQKYIPREFVTKDFSEKLFNGFQTMVTEIIEHATEGTGQSPRP